MSGRIFSSNLEYFVVLHDLRGFAEAARAIPMTVQGLRKAIAQLEEEMGGRLFSAGEEGSLVPTPAADELYLLARGWMGEADKLKESIRTSRKSGQRILRVAASKGVLGQVGFGVRSDFAQRQAGFAIDVVELPEPLVEDSLKKGVFDLAIVSEPADAALEYARLGSVGSSVWVNADHPLCRKNEALLSDLEGQRIVLTEFGRKAKAFYERAFAELGVAPASMSVTSEVLYGFDNFLAELEKGAVGISLESLGRIIGEKARPFASIALIDGYEWRFGLAHRKGYVPTEEETTLARFLAERFGESRR